MIQDTDKNQLYIKQDIDVHTDNFDKLMDLLEEIDNNLHSRHPVNITKLNLVDISSQPIAKQDSLWIQPYIMQNPSPLFNIPLPPPEPVDQKSNSLDRILLVVCSSVVIAVGMWTINHCIWLGNTLVKETKEIARSSSNIAP